MHQQGLEHLTIRSQVRHINHCNSMSPTQKKVYQPRCCCAKLFQERNKEACYSLTGNWAYLRSHFNSHPLIGCKISDTALFLSNQSQPHGTVHTRSLYDLLYIYKPCSAVTMAIKKSTFSRSKEFNQRGKNLHSLLESKKTPASKFKQWTNLRHLKSSTSLCKKHTSM